MIVMVCALICAWFFSLPPPSQLLSVPLSLDLSVSQVDKELTVVDAVVPPNDEPFPLVLAIYVTPYKKNYFTDP
jgi:hypothetical protein